MIATDIDGVLTDGRVTVSADGTEAKQISYRDLDAIGMGRRAGYEFAFITGEDSPMAQFFARRFGVQRLYAGTKDKLTALTALAHTEGIPLDAVLYIGDTDRDVPAMIAAGIGAAPADASPKALAAADIVTRTCGGTGVLYEIVSNLVDGVWVQR